MASRKEQKEQARAARVAQEQEAAAQAQRTRRIQIFGGVVAIAVIVIVAAIVISSGGGSNNTASKGQYAAVNKLLAGIPQNGTVLGNPSAKVTMTYYGDLECPICRDFTVTPGYFSQFIKDDVATGKVKVDYRSFCTATCNNHPQSVFNEQQVAAYAAGKQKLFWDYAELFYHEQQDETVSYVNSTWLTNLAKQIPKLNISTWEADQKDPALLSQLTSDNSAASQAGVSGTPSLFISGPKGSKQVIGASDSIPDAADLEAAVQAVS
jgi:protein-disulfide isomerase